MSIQFDEMVNKALTLPGPLRAQLAEVLLESLDFGDFPINDKWRQEIEHRCREIDEGTAVLIPAEEVFSEIRERLK